MPISRCGLHLRIRCIKRIESFAQLDDERLERMLNLLFAMGQQGRQSFVFTCHRRERESAEQMGLCAVLHLEPKP